MNRNEAYLIKWPLILIFTRFVLALVLQLLLSSIYFYNGNPNPIETAGRWFTVYGTLIDIACLVLIVKSVCVENEDEFLPKRFLTPLECDEFRVNGVSLFDSFRHQLRLWEPGARLWSFIGDKNTKNHTKALYKGEVNEQVLE